MAEHDHEPGRSPGTQPGAETDSTPASSAEACDLDDCACTGKNMVKFTSPAALLAVAEAGALSGWDIAERLRQMPLGGETGPDSGGLYRVLRRMERFNLLISEWDTSGAGPARRVYRLTELGDRCLQTWSVTLRAHREAVDSFLDDFDRLAGAGEHERPASR